MTYAFVDRSEAAVSHRHSLLRREALALAASANLQSARWVPGAQRRPIMRKSPVLAALVAAVAASTAQAASFECARARAADEKAICADRGLNDKDVTLAVSLKMTAHLMAMGGRGDLMDEQRAWLANRRRCGADRACLNKSYDARIAVVRTAFEAIASRGPF